MRLATAATPTAATATAVAATTPRADRFIYRATASHEQLALAKGFYKRLPSSGDGQHGAPEIVETLRSHGLDSALFGR